MIRWWRSPLCCNHFLNDAVVDWCSKYVYKFQPVNRWILGSSDCFIRLLREVVFSRIGHSSVSVAWGSVGISFDISNWLSIPDNGSEGLWFWDLGWATSNPSEIDSRIAPISFIPSWKSSITLVIQFSLVVDLVVYSWQRHWSIKWLKVSINSAIVWVSSNMIFGRVFANESNRESTIRPSAQQRLE